MSAPVPHPGPQSLVWLFFNPIGRISREPYWLSFVLIWAFFGIAITIWLRDAAITPEMSIQEAVGAFIEANPLLPLFMIGFTWVELALIIKRLQDRGLSGFLAIIALVPYINIPFIVGLGLIPGQDGPNAYGPGPNSRWKRPT
jgi:uncharacterized membrane protein YhaH (DUF805 family)